MENKEISYEFDEDISREYKVPFVEVAIESIMITHLRNITDEQWELLATAHTDSNTLRLLSDLCLDLVDEITVMALETLVPLVHTSNTSTTMDGTDGPETDLSYYNVTEETMQLCIGDTLHVCLGAVMGVVEDRSRNSDKLLQLVAAEVTRRVNHTLSAISRAPSLPQLKMSAGSDITIESLVDDMVYNTAQILHRCFWRRKQPEEGSQDSDISELSGPDEVTDVEDLNAADTESICLPSERPALHKFTGPDEVTEVEEFKAEGEEPVCSPPEGTVPPFHIIEASPSPAVDVSQGEKKSTGGTSSFVKKVRRFFWRNTAKVTPACEVVQLENGSTPQPPKKKKCPAITRMFSSMARILRKPFTSCISGGSQDD